MILEFAFSVSLSFDNHIKCDSFINNNNYTSQVTMELDRHQFTTKDINPDPYSYIQIKNQQLLDQQMIDQLGLDSNILQDEE